VTRQEAPSQEGGRGLSVLEEGAHGTTPGSINCGRTSRNRYPGRQNQRTRAPCVQHDRQSHGAWLKRCLFAANPSAQRYSFDSSKGSTNAVPRAVQTGTSSEPQERWHCADGVLVRSARRGPRRDAFSSNWLLRMEASFVPAQWTLPSDQGRRNKLPISILDTRPSPAVALQPSCSDMRIETCAC
jgi:hypothetical protein